MYKMREEGEEEEQLMCTENCYHINLLYIKSTRSGGAVGVVVVVVVLVVVVPWVDDVVVVFTGLPLRFRNGEDSSPFC